MTAKYEKEYIGQWKFEWLPRPLDGILYYDDDKRTLTLRVRSFLERGAQEYKIDPELFRKHYYDAGVIVGNVRYGGAIVLSGTRAVRSSSCRGRGGHIFEFDISVKYAFRDYHVGACKDVKLKCARVDFGEILGWTRTSAYEVEKLERRGPYDWPMAHRWVSAGIFGYSFALPNGGEVSFTPYASHPGTVLTSKVVSYTQGVNTSFRYKSSKEWNVVKSDIELIRHLIEFATTGLVGVDGGSFSQARDKAIASTFEPDDYKQIVFGDRIVGKTQDQDALNYVFTLPELLAVIKRLGLTWKDRLGRLEVALQLYDEIVRTDSETKEVLFVRLVQLLEHLHSLVYKDDARAYFRRMYEMWGDNDQCVAETRSLLIGSRKPDRPTLKMRIYEMSRAHGRWLVSNPMGDDGIAFAEKVAKTRHYFTHHNLLDEPKSFKGKDVEEVARFLQQLVRYHILKYLGFSERFALHRMGWSSESSRELFALKHTPIGKEKINV